MAQHQLQLLQIGIVLIFVGIIAIIISLLTGAAKEKDKGSFKFSVVGFFGFIPFGFGNDKKLMMLTLILATVVVAATIVLFSRNIKP